ncbi:MAG: ATP-binding protein, partial [Pseudoxanthomonas sp.]
GTGIGMATVHRFVLDHGGAIEADSAPGEGTRIRIRLPLAESGYGIGDDVDLEIPQAFIAADDRVRSPSTIAESAAGRRAVNS